MTNIKIQKKELDILCIIPARGGSKGVPDKNIKLLGGYPLVAYSIAAAKSSKKITRVIVSTDTQKIANISRDFGAEVPFLRPEEFSGDKATDMEYISHALKWLKDNEEYCPDLVVLLRPTTPFRDSAYIDDAITEMASNETATSLRSSHMASESPFKWFYVKDKFYTPISDDYTLEDTGRPRQSFPPAYIPNGYVDIIRSAYVKNNDSLFGDKIFGYITSIGYEVDTKEEFEYLEYQITKQNLKIINYLNKIKSKT